MVLSEKTTPEPNRTGADVVYVQDGDTMNLDDVLLAKLGYKSEFRREFSVSNGFVSVTIEPLLTQHKLVETVAFAFSIMGVIASVTSTLSFGLASGRRV